jgi:hypothetical protein
MDEVEAAEALSSPVRMPIPPPRIKLRGQDLNLHALSDAGFATK